jgi:hypothetical protein
MDAQLDIGHALNLPFEDSVERYTFVLTGY